MINMIRASVVALALCATAQADAFLDFVSEPTGSSTKTEFIGDWESLTGTLIFEDVEVTGLIYQDGTMGPPASDTVLGAGVDITAHFINGVLDASASNFIEISDGSDIFYKAGIYGGEMNELGFVFDFSSRLSTDTTGLGLPVVNQTAAGNESDWIAENATSLRTSGANVEFLGILTGSAGTGPNGVTGLTNIYGKLTPTPEPGTLALCGAAAIGFFWVRRRRRA